KEGAQSPLTLHCTAKVQYPTVGSVSLRDIGCFQGANQEAWGQLALNGRKSGVPIMVDCWAAGALRLVADTGGDGFHRLKDEHGGREGVHDPKSCTLGDSRASRKIHSIHANYPSIAALVGVFYQWPKIGNRFLASLSCNAASKLCYFRSIRAFCNWL